MPPGKTAGAACGRKSCRCWRISGRERRGMPHHSPQSWRRRRTFWTALPGRHWKNAAVRTEALMQTLCGGKIRSSGSASSPYGLRKAAALRTSAKCITQRWKTCCPVRAEERSAFPAATRSSSNRPGCASFPDPPAETAPKRKKMPRPTFQTALRPGYFRQEKTRRSRKSSIRNGWIMIQLTERCASARDGKAII